MMSSDSIHLPSNNIISFFFMAEQYSIIYIAHMVLIHSAVVGHLSCSPSLATMNSVAINKDMQVSLLHPNLYFFGICLRVVSPGHMVLLFLVFKDSPYCFS
jgi:hypothetical protein